MASPARKFTMRASTRQSAQVTAATLARSRPGRSELARLSTIHAPAGTVHDVPRLPAVRAKSSLKSTPPAGGVPASGGPASGTPASGVPASGGGDPASGGSAPAVPLTTKFLKKTPATLVAMPAVPGDPMADALASLKVAFTAPLTEAISCTGPLPVELRATVE